MAIAGLHNASVLDSSFLRESQSLTSRRWVSRDRSRTNSEDGSEDANEVENESGTWLPEGRNSPRSEHSNESIDFGDLERERVRQIFQEWKNTGGRARGGSNVPVTNNRSRGQWLGENERGRVRIIREWVQMNSQERGTDGGRSEEQSAEIGDQIEQVRDGFIVSHGEVRSPRPIRKLCGRQLLLDLLVRAEMERKRELQGLLERRPVADFPHRNRIQSLLRGRFLRNERLIRDERPTSVAVNELGLLRQRHTVSDLREGFLSRVDNCVPCPASSIQSDSSSGNDTDTSSNEQIEINNSQGNHEPSDPTSREIDICVFTNDLPRSTGENLSGQQPTVQVDDQLEQVLENDERVQQFPSNFEFFESGDVSGSGQVSSTEELSQETSRNDESEERGHQPEALQQFQEMHEPVREESDGQGSPNHTDNIEASSVENISWHELAVGNEETAWQLLDNVDVGEWGNSSGEDMTGNSHEVSANEWYQTSETEEEGHMHMQEQDEVWHENNIHEDMGNWLEGPSVQDAALVGTGTSFYLPENDNDQSTEIRELLSRRSVSSLLQSGFRESLDQLIQSYVERQGHASGNWEEDETLSSPPLMDHDLEQQSGEQYDGRLHSVERTPLVLPAASVTSSQPLWDQELHDSNWSRARHNLHQHLGIDWETINDLRIDLARLHQRMNNMQRMLEACMDMQLELQRAVRQEVSAALNRSAVSTAEDGDSVLMDASKWDHVRKGICCICSDSNIDSLLYRCGHMCTCSKCADKLVQGSGKCPMCYAPVVEVIRAYCIQ